MNVQLVTVATTAAVSVATTLVAVFLGPAWKDRVDSRRSSRQRSEQLIARYSEPLARAAFDLQSRLYNICRQHFMIASGIPALYRGFSTLWFYGQLLAWIEIVRREVQVIDVGDVRRTAQLQRRLFDVVDIMATDSIPDRGFRILRADQRAIGEAMVTERSTDEHPRSDSIGYAEFMQRMAGDITFARWFTSLATDIEVLMNGGSPGPRLALTQRALIDLIDFIDPDWIRFPDANERGKLPAPQSIVDHKRRRPPTEVARFRFEQDPLPIFSGWARNHANQPRQDLPRQTRVRLSRPFGRTGHDVVMVTSPPWVELHIIATGHPLAENVEAGRRSTSRGLSPKEIDVLNQLLTSFDRPKLPHTFRRFSPS
jgi:hypothetical protein